MKRLTPIIFEINTVTWLNELKNKYQVSIDLASIPSLELEKISKLDIDAVWLMGVWQRSPIGRDINLKDDVLIDSIKANQSTYSETSIIGSAYSISGYQVDARMGGDSALAILKTQLNKLGIKLILDFVPNHVAIDNPWTKSNPEYFIHGTANELDIHSDAFIRVGDQIYALGKDPNYPAWNDVVQLNIFNDQLVKRLIELVGHLMKMCDGIRCDMAILLLNNVFKNTWGNYLKDVEPPTQEFWRLLIDFVKKNNPDFCLIAECYWNKQEELIKLGFDYCYDKDYYDSLKTKDVKSLISNLSKPLDFQQHLLRFIENHDEPRAASVFNYEQHKLAALLLMTSPGAKLYYMGQFEGFSHFTPVHTSEAATDKPDLMISDFYDSLRQKLKQSVSYVNGWQLLKPESEISIMAKSTNEVIVFYWFNQSGHYLSLANFSSRRKRFKVILPIKSKPLSTLSYEIIFTTNKTNNSSSINIKNNILIGGLRGYQGLVIKLN